MGNEADLRDLLRTLSPAAREHLRGVLIHDKADRDAISSKLVRYRDGHGDDWDRHHRHADDASGRGGKVRLLGEIGAAATS